MRRARNCKEGRGGGVGRLMRRGDIPVLVPFYGVCVFRTVKFKLMKGGGEYWVVDGALATRCLVLLEFGLDNPEVIFLSDYNFLSCFSTFS